MLGFLKDTRLWNSMADHVATCDNNIESETSQNNILERVEGIELVNSASEEAAETKEREITQTDHLNKRLLGAFLDRINQTEFIVPPQEESNADDDFSEPVSDINSTNNVHPEERQRSNEHLDKI